MSGQRDRIVYEAELLPGRRAQLYREVWDAGERIERVPTGSPAPLETVRKHEEIIYLDRGENR